MKALLRSAGRAVTTLRQTIVHTLAAYTPLRAAEDAVLLLIALQLTILGANWINGSNPILGLRLEGQLIGQLPGPDFRKQANAISYSYENNPFTLKAAEETDILTLRQFGVNVNESQLHSKLLSVGRTGNIITKLADQDGAPFGGRNILFESPGFNTTVAQQYIDALNQKIDIPPANAYFALENQQAVVRQDKPGRAINAEAAIVALQTANPGNPKPLELPTKQVSALVTAPVLNRILPEVQAIIQKPLTIAAGDSRTNLSPEQLLSLIVPKVTADPADPARAIAHITFDESRLNTIIDEVVTRAVVAPKPTIMSGTRLVQQGQNGVGTEDSHSLARVLTALVQRQTGISAPDEARIPLVAISPPVVQQSVNTPRTKTGSGLIRLTFDDGPGGYTEQVLDILGRYNVHATFYVIGRNVERYPGTMRRIKNEGHIIGNHSFSHADLTRLSHAGVVQELSSTQAAVRAACGVTPTAFRPPYGAHNQTVRGVAASLGMSVDMWSIDANDWAKPGSSVITRRVLQNTHSGAVVLLHTLNQQTVNALPSIIEGIRTQGFRLE